MANALEFLKRKRVFLSLMGIIFSLFIMAHEAQATHNSCSAHIEKYERHYKIPQGLLHAISKVESGRKNEQGHLIPWPWTINVDGQGYFFPTKQAAIAAVETLQKKGVKKIDVGCMQINLHYHPQAFKTLADAFEPRQNVAYAAEFLLGLQKGLRSWYKAIGHYNTANPVHHVSYQKNVMAVWNRDRQLEGFSLAADLMSQDPEMRRARHIRRLGSGKTLKLTPVSERSVSRKITRGPSSHIRRLQLSSR